MVPSSLEEHASRRVKWFGKRRGKNKALTQALLGGMPAEIDRIKAEQAVMTKARYRHWKTGGVYFVICEAVDEHTNDPVVVYQSEEKGTRWVRPAHEFYDGRFELIQRARLT